jgi:tetratricopeptide (TPR) repeat protein
MAEALHQHALFEGYVHSSTEADGLFAEALAAAERHDDPGLAASVVHGAALAPWYRSEVAIAHERIADAIERLHALPAGPERFFHAVSLGQPVLPIGLDGEPRLTWDATLVMFHRLDREEALVLAYNNLAWILRVEGDTDAAREQIDHALHHARACGDEPGEALTLGHLGHLLRTTGELDLAREHLAAGIDRFRAFGERRDADVLALGLGLAHGDAGDVDQARATFGTALGRFVATEDSPAIAGAHGVWGLMEERTGALDEAHDHYALSAAGWIGQGLGRIGGWCAYAAASMSHRLGAAEDALAEASAARDLLAAAGNARGVAACDALLAAHSALSGCKEPRP